MQSQLFNSSQGVLHYMTAGEGQAVLLIHGFCEDHRVWLPIARQLSAGYRVIVPDLIGFGKSTAPEMFDFSMRSQAGALIKLLDSLGIDRAVWCGHSMGGYVSLQAAAIDEKEVAGMILLNSTAAADSEERKENRNKTIRVVEKNPELFFKEFYVNLFAPHHRERFAKAVDAFREAASAIDPQSIIETLKGLRDREDFTARLGGFSFPLLYILGKLDQLIPFEATAMQAAEARANVIALEDSAHMGFIEEEERTANALAAFLAQVYAGSDLNS